MISGRYSLDRVIGRGGMGAVWLGRDEVLGRQVALKQIGLLPGADSTDLARAEREARLAAHLNHPHVVAVFNVEVDADSGARWLVMEYVEGTTLADLVREEGPLSPDDAAPLLWQVADALAAAHAAGIVHRDVKPSNILLDRNRRAKLTDFGIARIAADPALTQTGLVTGSPAYIAPEIAAGQRGDEAVDVWSLGATVFHVLAGRPPYEIGDYVLGGLYRIVHEEPPRLAEAGWLAPLLESSMVKDPAHRWSMARVRDFLGEPPPRGTSTTRAVPAVPPTREPQQQPQQQPTRMLPPERPAPQPAPPATQATSALATDAGQGGEGTSPPAPPVVERPAARSGQGSRRRPWLLGLGGLAVAVVLALGLLAVLPDDDPAGPAAPTPSATPTPTPSSGSPSPSPSPSPTTTAATARGMRAFIGRYVAALGSDPETAWTMLTPRFQRESGGLDAYRTFWSGVGRGQILEISADPEDLVVSYRVRFENFGTGERPTVLDLVFDGERYLIDGESTEGSTPAG